MAITNLNDYLKSIADSIRAKKGTTAPINAQNFASEIESISGGTGGATLKSGWIGTAVPVDATTTIENIYLNTQLSNEEVASLIDNNSSLFDSDMGCFIACTENQSTILSVVSMEGMYAIMDYATEYVYFVYSADHQAEIITQFGFSGWNPEFNGNVVFNSINIATTLGMMSSAHIEEVVENFKSLISTTPFEKENITLNGTYEGKELVITESGNINLTNNITNDKEIITSVSANLYDYKKWLNLKCPDEIDITFEGANNEVVNIVGMPFKKFTARTTGASPFPEGFLKQCVFCEYVRLEPSDDLFDDDKRGGGLYIFRANTLSMLMSLKTLILNYKRMNSSFKLNTMLSWCAYFNGTSPNISFPINGVKTQITINPNAEKTGVIYVNDAIYDEVIADTNNSNYVSQIKRLSEYVEE